MSKNNLIRKSDKKFIRLEKARIRATFFDMKKQEELINNLYKKFEKQPEVKTAVTEIVEPKKTEAKEVKKAVKAKPKKEKAVITTK